MKNVGLVGFGEVGSRLCLLLGKSGRTPLVFCSGQRHHPPYEPSFVAAVEERGGRLAESVEDLCNRCRYIFSVVTSDAAPTVANALASFAESGNLVVDVNSTSPQTKQRIAATLAAANVVDAALVSSALDNAPLKFLVSGPLADEVAGWLNSFAGMQAQAIGPKVGSAATIKMLRSAVNKGLVMMYYEAMLAAERMDELPNFWRYIVKDLDSQSFEERIRLQLIGTVMHRERRYHEMKEVKDLLESTGQASDFAACAVRAYDVFRRAAFQDMRMPESADSYDIEKFVQQVSERLPRAPR